MTVEEQALGLDFREALVNLTRRVDSLDLRFFVTAVRAAARDRRQPGRDPARTRRGCIRDRFRVLGDIQTFTAQGRLTGAILVLLPLVMALFTLGDGSGVLPARCSRAEAGRRALVVAGAMQILGMLVDPPDRQDQGLAMFLLIFSVLVFATIARRGLRRLRGSALPPRSPVAARLRELRSTRTGETVDLRRPPARAAQGSWRQLGGFLPARDGPRRPAHGPGPRRLPPPGGGARASSARR